jgi:glycerophosphoryl diester phosphodiesterase
VRRVPELRRTALKRVGHKGAHHVAPGNTLESFDAALEHGVDMIEFDVLRLGDGRIVLAHDPDDAAAREPLSLEQGLGHFAGETYAGVELDVDLKLPGYEREVVDGLLERGLGERSLVSTQYLDSLAELGRLAPGLRRGWSVPRVRRDYTRGPLAVPAYGVARVLRARLPGQAARALAAGRCEAVMAHWLLASARLARAVHEAGGELYVWTVDDVRRISALERLGVDGVITNDPRLFDALGQPPSRAP